MTLRTSRTLYLVISGSIFLMVALLHLLRLVYHWPITIGSWTLPHWVSYVGFPAASGYCIWAFWLSRR